jgi:CelD/BcsL family acetyltransferase involved in cellulose biosynthesis
LYGFVTAGKFDLYQLGVGTSEGSDVTSPGMAANLLLMDQLAAQGIARYDFLRGASRYKTSWTTEQRELVSLLGRRRSLRALVHDAIALLARVYRKIMRMFTRRKAKGQG